MSRSFRPRLPRMAYSLLILVLLPGAFAARVVEWCSRIPVEPAVFGKSQPITQLYECEFVSPLHIPYIWSPVKLQVLCPAVRYKVHVGDSQHSLVDKINRHEEAWCGLRSLFWDGRICDIQVSPFQTHYIGIKASSYGPECTLETEATFSYTMLLCLLMGALLFSSATSLSSSLAFRICCGALSFVACSLLIILILLLRSAPFKRQFSVAVLVLGSSGLAAVRWATGQWMPSLDALVHNQLVMGYVLLSASIGAAVTYYYDDRDDPKLNTLIKMILSLSGLVLVYCGTWTFFPLTAAIISLLLASSFSPEMAEAVQQHITPFVSPFVTPFTTPFVQHSRPAPAPRAATPASGGPRQTGSPDFTFSALRERLLGVSPGSPASKPASPLHLRYPPPEPPVKPWLLDIDDHVKTFDDKMAEHHKRSVLQSPATASVPVRGSAVGKEDNTQGEGSPGVSDRVLNVTTGRYLKVGGSMYKQLLRQGHIPNLEQGVISPPPSPAQPPAAGASKIPSVQGGKT